MSPTQPFRRVFRPVRIDRHHRYGGHLIHQKAQHLQCGRVSPMQIFHHEQQRLARRSFHHDIHQRLQRQSPLTFRRHLKCRIPWRRHT